MGRTRDMAQSVPSAHGMRTLMIFAVLSLPAAASAQAAGALGDPTGAAPVVTPEGYHYPGLPEASPAQPPSYLSLDPERAPVAALRDRPRGVRFGQSFGHAWMGFGLGAGVGAAVGALATELGCSDDFSCGSQWAIGAAVGGATTAPLGAAISVWAWGESRGAGGNFFASLAGAYLGGGVGVGLTAAMFESRDFGLALAAMFIGPVVGSVLANLGAVIGYHVTASGPDEQTSSDGPTPAFAPTIAPTEDGRGATVGAVGVF